MPPAAPAPAATVAVATAPLMWTLLTAGFEGLKGVFNGSWQLALRPAPRGECVWDNGGDGAAVPIVELRCAAPLATTWRLTLRHGSDELLEYTRPAAEWNPFAANVVHRSDQGTAAPDHLTLTPA